ncbi:VRR-NUC domain-containing protein [Maribacter dokdonensis]|uniref:VRR-NUC domain-containing protein n=1 Tax=Maribacter dokdonensis TaxID=320912 RepID=A0ABY0V0J0_9FLAO|nr:VRR-NUC domain-containing protein [Maribacter dokdonensis]SDT46798.1 VRR-NUC domain-containing protein [Maribacter dokdonensis]
MDITESRLQQNIFSKHWNQYPEERRLLFAVNNNSFNAIKGAQMKSLGVVKGVSDLIYINPRKRRTQFLELKIKGGRQQKEQKDFEEKVKKLGFEYHLIFSLKEFNKVTNLNLK